MYWYGLSGDVSTDPADAAARLRAAKTDMSGYVPCDWCEAERLGLVKDRQEYLAAVRRAAIYLAE